VQLGNSQYCLDGIDRLGIARYAGRAMHKCVLCGADTILFINGIPICVECDEEREKKTPQYHLLAKTQDAIVPRGSV